MTQTEPPGTRPDLDVLVVGGGPTGLTLAAQLVRFGVRFRIVDRQIDRARESRALAVQARSLEVLQTIGLGEALASRGRTTTRVMLHVDRGEPPSFELGTVGRTDTRFPFILFVSQAETEGVLMEHLASRGVFVERGVELVSARPVTEGVHCTLRSVDGREESLMVRYVAGCDGAHSLVRKLAAIPFEGGAYPQEFALGDVEANGDLPLPAIHAFVAARGLAMFFPLGSPTTWRVMAMDPRGPSRESHVRDDQPDVTTHPLSLAELQSMIEEPTCHSVRLRDAQWLTRFRLHHRQAVRYREDRFFLAGDAAHIHSPVGAQGMNTGVQDAWNLGWKLAMVVRGRADERLLDSYHAERWPVGNTLLRVTDRIFGMFAKSISGGSAAIAIRRLVVRGLVARGLSRPGVRDVAFHFVSQLGVHYRSSAYVTEGEPRLRTGARAGDRLPDAKIVRDGRPTYLQEELAGPRFHVLLCGPVASWAVDQIATLERQFAGLVAVTHLAREASPEALVDAQGEALDRLGVESAAQYVVRPDGHIGFRCAGTDMRALAEYFSRWFVASSAR